jgi:hypothetical protein
MLPRDERLDTKPFCYSKVGGSRVLSRSHRTAMSARSSRVPLASTTGRADRNSFSPDVEDFASHLGDECQSDRDGVAAEFGYAHCHR